MALSLLFLSILIKTILSLDCPVLSCNGKLDEGVCYKHDLKTPTTLILGQTCMSDDEKDKTLKVCPFSL